MKVCPRCNVEVGNNAKVCPLCQSGLIGGDGNDEKFWPDSPRVRHYYIIYKIQLFIVISAIVVIVLLNLWMSPKSFIRLSILPVALLIIAEITIRSIMKSHSYIPGIIFRCTVAVIIALLLCSVKYPVLIPIIPTPLIGLLIFNFIATFVGRHTNVVVCYLCNAVILLLSWLAVVVILKDQSTALWEICFLTGCITIVGTTIFRGRTLFTELRKRLNI